MTIKVRTNLSKQLEVKGFKISWLYIFKGNIHFEIIDTNKYSYENGYNQTTKRKLTKNKTINFKGVILDLSELDGVNY